MNLKEYITHIKSICKQGILRHKNVILDETFQKELLEIIKCYEQLQQENQALKKQLEIGEEQYNDLKVSYEEELNKNIKLQYELEREKKENQQLKEQLESSIGIVKHNMIIQKHVDRERKLQKKIEAKEEGVEFIEYLENKISELNEITKNEEDEETIHYGLVRITAINEILLTYKK